MRSDQDWQRILGLSASAVGGAVAITVFCFSSFVTKAEQQIESDHAKAEQQNVHDDINHIRDSIEKLSTKIDRLLERQNDHR